MNATGYRLEVDTDEARFFRHFAELFTPDGRRLGIQVFLTIAGAKRWARRKARRHAKGAIRGGKRTFEVTL